MKILIDIGNTTIGIALYKNEQIIKKIIISTEIDKAEDEYHLILQNLLKDYISESADFILISSVVPKLNRSIKSVFWKIFNIEPQILSIGFKTGVLIKIDNPLELGSDLVCDIVGGVKFYQSPMIIVDLGTATKILVVDKTGAFIGCSIAPGIAMSFATLTDKASLLPDTELSLPKNVIGKNTFESLKSGAVLGHAEMIKGICYQIEKKLGYPLKRILTGGNSYPIKEYLMQSGFVYNENLLFEGMNAILEKNCK